jgi:hypothetical protein
MSSSLLDYPNLTPDARQDLLRVSHEFLSTLAQISSADFAHQSFCRLAETIHPQLQLDLFQMLLDGDYKRQIRLGTVPEIHFVAAIRTVRAYSGLSLAESRRIVDLARNHQPARFTLLLDKNRQECIRDFALCGVVAS